MTALAESPREPGRGGDRARATRAALVELAAELFAEKGYVQTSIRDIARRGSLTTGAIYGHFRNKADLLAAAINARTAEELEAQSIDLGHDIDYVETLTRLGREAPRRRRLRALIVQGAAAAQTDDATRTSLREEQLSHLNAWIDALKSHRDQQGIDPSVDVQAAILHTWAAELGLGVLEGLGIEPRSKKAWADVQNRVARGLKLPPDQPRKRPAAARRKRTAPQG